MIFMPSLIKRIALILGCLMALAVIPALAQNASQNILPDSFAGWTATSHQTFKPGDQPATTGATDPTQAAAASREYGLVSGEMANYTRGSAAGGNTLNATIYRMKDPSGAYGQYSYLRTPDMTPANFADHSSQKPNEAVVLIGNLVLKLDGPIARRDADDIKQLVSTLAAKSESGLYPTLPEHMPGQYRVDRSDHYILGPQTLNQFFPVALGNSLGFNYGPEVETSRFKVDGQDLTMLIADFPTPQIAQSQLDSLSKAFNINSSQPSATSPALFADRTQTMVAIVAGAQTSDQAHKLLDQVQPGSVLTWDQPTFQFKEPRFEVMVVGAFVGTGIICLLTMIGALAFGGFRLTIKRMFPNTIFDRSSQIDILQMGLVSKPIKAEDFYAFDGKRVDTGTVDKNLPDRTALRLFK
jgi:hypothetical protein